jgi:phosphoheptose isomerase
MIFAFFAMMPALAVQTRCPYKSAAAFDLTNAEIFSHSGRAVARQMDL